LANYRHLVDVLDAEINRSKRTGREFALLLLDLDRLKEVNDRYGHVTGSQALCRLADALCICCRDLDTPARFGGDEFAIVLPETGTESANLVARRVRDSFANDGREPKLSVGVGVAIYPKDGKTIDTLLPAAEAAMYAMKGRSSQPQRGRLARAETAHHTSESALILSHATARPDGRFSERFRLASS
jgi:diguanylate cyclase (GGDEF)-like protein